MGETAKKFQMVVKALIRNEEGEVLIIRKEGGSQHGLWDLPGGRVEYGEFVEDALRREILEECGMELVKVGAILHVSGFVATSKSMDHIFKMIHECSARGGITLGDEHSKYKWVSVDTLSTYEYPKDGYLEAFKKIQ